MSYIREMILYPAQELEISSPFVSPRVRVITLNLCRKNRRAAGESLSRVRTQRARRSVAIRNPPVLRLHRCIGVPVRVRHCVNRAAHGDLKLTLTVGRRVGKPR